jgi:2,6-dihydroxypseudooxynicotine hydrolase
VTDTLLRTAIANWEPRFCANGVDASDYARLTASIESWNDWCRAWSRAAGDYERLATAALEHGHTRSAGEHYARASTYHHFGKFLFVHDPDQARAASDAANAALVAALPHLVPRGQRVTVPYEGRELVGIFRAPAGTGPFPTVWLIPGLDSTKEEFREVERAFLDRGMATFACDGPGQGEVEWHLPIEPDWGKVGMAVLRTLRTLDAVDDDRIGVWGVSLGGYYAARVAAAGLPVRATVVLSGPYNFGAAFPALNPLTQQAFVVRSGARSIAEAQERANQLSLAGHAGDITEPLMVIMGAKDRLFSPNDGERLVNEASGPSTFVLLPEGNHGCANVINAHRPMAADWMADQLRTLPTEGNL